MGLFDGFVPQGFADRGGMLGRLLSLRPDLAQDGEGTDQPPPDQTVQAPGQHPNDISTSSPASSAIGSALDDFYRQTILQGAKDVTGYASDAIHDPLYFLHAIGPSLGGLGPVASELPGAVKGVLGTVGLARSAAPPEADHPLEIAGSAVRDTRTVAAPSVGGASVGPVGSSGSNSLGPMQRGLLPGLGLAAALASRKSSELLAGARRPIAPVFPEPPVAPVPPQTPSMPPHAVPAAPQTGPIPPGPTSAPGLIPTPPSSDDGEDALGPAWQQWQSFLDNIRHKGSSDGDEEPESEAEKNERCRKERIDAIKRCLETHRRDYNRNMFGKTPFDLDNCIKGFLSPDCEGNDSSAPENYYHGNYKNWRKPGRGSRRKK